MQQVDRGDVYSVRTPPPRLRLSRGRSKRQPGAKNRLTSDGSVSQSPLCSNISQSWHRFLLLLQTKVFFVSPLSANQWKKDGALMAEGKENIVCEDNQGGAVGVTAPAARHTAVRAHLWRVCVSMCAQSEDALFFFLHRGETLCNFSTFFFVHGSPCACSVMMSSRNPFSSYLLPLPPHDPLPPAAARP